MFPLLKRPGRAGILHRPNEIQVMVLKLQGSLRQRFLVGSMALLCLGLLVSCGSEAPTYETGAIQITSTPAGAAILLDGNDTGFVTPFTLTDLDPNRYEISVSLTDFVANPQSATVELPPAKLVSVDFSLSQTGLRITSPEGARIFIDGLDTGRITPAAVAGLAPGPVMVSLVKETYHAFPVELEVVVLDTTLVEVSPTAFILRPRRTVMLEGFANVSCIPCPQLTDNLVTMSTKPGFGSDRVLFMEFSVSWPDLADPFYLDNPSENAARYTRYQVLGAPDLLIDGGNRLPDTLDPVAMENVVKAQLQADPGFLVDVSADFSQTTVAVQVVLTPFADRDLTNHSLMVAVYENLVDTGTAPGGNGQTEFHHVFRDMVDAPPNLGLLTAGVPVSFDLQVNRGAIDPGNITAVAFVQNDTDNTIIQAGSTVTPVLPQQRIQP